MNNYFKAIWNLMKNPTCAECLTYSAVAFLLTVFVGILLRVLALEFIVIESLNFLQTEFGKMHHFAGWTLFAFAPMAALVAALGIRRLLGRWSMYDRELIKLVEVAGYAIGLLGTLIALQMTALPLGVTSQNMMSAFNPLEIGIALWVCCQLVGWNFDDRRGSL